MFIGKKSVGNFKTFSIFLRIHRNEYLTVKFYVDETIHTFSVIKIKKYYYNFPLKFYN